MASHLAMSASTLQRGTRHQLWVLWRYWLLREWKTRYAGSTLGVAWAFVQPAATLAIFYVLFGLLLSVRVPGVAASNGYLLHLLAGLAVWLPFADAVGRGVGCLAAYEDFLRKQPMPAEILPAVAVGSSLLVLVIGYGALFASAVSQGTMTFSGWMVIPVLICVQLFLTLGITMLLSMAHFLWRDVGSAVAFVLQLWFYVTPVVYPLSQVPSAYHHLYLFNPLACLVLGVQSQALGLPVPDGLWLSLFAWTLMLGCGGIWFFRTMKSALGEAL